MTHDEDGDGYITIAEVETIRSCNVCDHAERVKKEVSSKQNQLEKEKILLT